MASITSIVSGLQSFGATVANPAGGFVTSYDLSHYYDQLLGKELPCLIVAPSPKQGIKWATQSFMGNNPITDAAIDHVLLYSQNLAAAKKGEVIPNLIKTVDNYLIALAALPFLTALTSPAIHQPAKPEFRFVPVKWGETLYVGGVFSYQFTINT